jgi:hypothetical protein
MKFLKTTLIVLLVSILFVGCYTIKYNMGSGPQTSQTATATQWYALWGLVQINHPNIQGMIGDAKNYEYCSQITPTNFVINIFTQYVTVYSQTITVKK